MQRTCGIGIDTGGTYTDAVVYDFETRKILDSSKALTTRDDLSRGILEALDQLDPQLLQRAGMVALSTTLATNACVEGKGGRAKLLFIGIDKKTVDWVGREAGLTDPEVIWCLDARTSIDGRVCEAPDWEQFLKDSEDWFRDADALAVVALNASSNGAVLEKEALSAIEARHPIPVIAGHELFSDLDAIKRGASALLNGRLIPVLAEFLEAIRRSLKARNLDVPVAIVRSDGSLMSERFTGVRPVETILCGPAASIVGGQALSGEREAVIVDMGGTTTDIALIRDGNAVKATSGILIGAWHTFVKGVYVETLGLGGDSAVRLDKSGALTIESRRVIPLSMAASRWPGVKPSLQKLLSAREKHSLPLHEFFALVKDIEGNPGFSEEEKRFCRALQDGPLIYEDAARALGRDLYSLDVQRLEREGVVIRAGLTPTDVMHLRGDFAAFDREVALLGAQFVSNSAGTNPAALGDWVYGEIKRKLYLSIAGMLIREDMPSFHKAGVGQGLTRFLNRAWQMSKSPSGGTRFQVLTDSTLVGVGAPIHLFLPDVARALGAKCAVPKLAGVANALGAVAGNVAAESAAIIRPWNEGLFQVLGTRESVEAENLEEATRLAREIAERGARLEAARRGAAGELVVRFEEKPLVSQTGYGSDVFIEAKVTATAIGKLGL
jgi:N-methylhydantoinase A/oxoprolinase/acetone carboxylase beta subunit